MPRWSFHSKALTAWRRRWRLNRDPTEILDGILPVAEIDKHWTDDRINLWGLFTQAQGTGANTHLACMITAQTKELLVHRVQYSLTRSAWPIAQPVHLFTPLQGYVPTVNNTALHLPWLQTGLRAGDPGQLSEAFGTSGDNLGLQVVLVNGAPHICIGPITHGPFVAGVIGAACVREERLWTFQDPPIRIAPWTSLCVQMAAVSASALDMLNVSFFYSEREDQGRVG